MIIFFNKTKKQRSISWNERKILPFSSVTIHNRLVQIWRCIFFFA